MNIGFIGTGKIAAAVVESISTSSLEDYHIYLSPRNEIKSRELASRFEKISREDDNQDVIDKSDVVFLALRPTVFKEVVSMLNFRPEQKIVSLIPFSYYDDLVKAVSPAQTISRATPLPTVLTHTCPIPVYKPDPEVMEILQQIGQPFEVMSEEELHTIWTITCLISPYYDLLAALGEWAAGNAVKKGVAEKYIADMFNTLSYAAHLQDKPGFSKLSHHAATPGGLNERAAGEISDSGAHDAYVEAANNIRNLFKN
jgi:pyrroline-5-carboxylate reductase